MLLLAMFFVAAGFLVGTVIGLLAFVLRKRAGGIWRKRLLLILGLLAFLVTFFGGAGILANAGESTVQCEVLLDFASCSNLLDEDGVRMEVYLRSLIPPALRGGCMLGNLDACRTIRDNPAMLVADTTAYAALWIGSLLSALVAYGVARFALRTSVPAVHRK